MIPYNSEHIEAEEQKAAIHRSLTMDKLNSESREKYKKLEELIGEIDKLGIPFYTGVLTPIPNSYESHEPTAYSCVAYHNVHKFGTNEKGFVAELLIKEFVAMVVRNFGKQYSEHFEGDYFRSFWAFLERIHRHVTKKPLKEEAEDNKKAYEYLNNETGLNLKP